MGLIHLLAQQTNTQQWIKFGVQKSLNRSWELSLEEDLRCEIQDLSLKSYRTDLGISYKFNNEIKSSFHIKLISKPISMWASDNEFRSYFDLDFSKKTKWFRIENSLRIFYQDKRFIPDPDDHFFADSGLRYKLEFKTKSTNKTKAFIGSQLYVPFSMMTVNRFRLYFGSDYKINQQNKLEFLIYYQRKFSGKNIESIIPSITYQFSF